MDSSDIKYIYELLKNNKVSEANQQLEQMDEAGSADYWMLKGNIEQKSQNWSAALNAFLKVLEIDENNKEAQNSIHFIQNILNFWNPEMFNP